MARLPLHPPLPTTTLVALSGVAALTCAAALWLNQSSTLATIGQRIYELDLERQALLERRAIALVTYAAATDPRRLETRARALGLAPAPVTEALALANEPGAMPAALVAGDSPLALTGATVSVRLAEPTWTERLLSGSLSAASASEREVPTAVGGAP